LADTDLPENEQPESTQQGEGLPLWMPLAGLVIAFAFAVFVGIRVCPTLSGVVLPPSAPVPATGTITLLKHDQKGTGLDEWLYGSDQKGCDVARFYEQRLSDCTYDPDSNCASPVGTQPILTTGQLVVQCSGTDTFGAYKVLWTVYVSTGYSEGGQTHFRVIREVAS
jgi:hypothetical protein